MGVVNWLGVLVSAGVAGAVLWLFWRAALPLWAYALQIVPAAMLGHALARIGADKLAQKPHLFFMQSGGLAIAFVIPAVWMLGLRSGSTSRAMVRDSAAFLIAYIAMGAVFFAL